MVRLFKVLMTLNLLNSVKMFNLFPRHSHSHSRTFFNMKKEMKGIKNLKTVSNLYYPKSANQELYVKNLNDPNTKIIIAIGPAGTGKTLLACNQAIKELNIGNINKIIITRPVVPVEEEEIGFLPGNINKKMDPWMRPIFDIFNDYYNNKDLENMLYNNVIEISPLAFMRGRTFKNAYIIADEMQNSSPNQMKMLTTRIGDGSKMIITGDLKQCDRSEDSGLSDLINKYKKYQNHLLMNGNDTNIGIKINEFENGDIERSVIINKILNIYDYVERPLPLPNIKKSKKEMFELTNVENDAALIPTSQISKNFRE